MYRRILLPTDGSEGARAAIEHAFRLAEYHEASIRGLYVVNEAKVASGSVELTWEGLHTYLYEEGKTVLTDLENWAENHPVTVETTIREGRPSSTIIDEATRADCDLIVMGTHGRVGIDRLLLGSVAERVVRTAPVPVLTVRTGD